jgi:hypothetical protein
VLQAEQKALMARAPAYASGETPEFDSVSPDGSVETWRLSDLLFVLLVVPPDAPPELEYALRLRRDASLSGQCDDCGAAFDIECLESAGRGSIGTGLFPHKGTCLASDENILPFMVAYYKAQERSSIEEMLEAASRDTGARLAAVMSDQVRLPKTDGNHKRLTEILDEKIANSRHCGHLTSRPAQTWSIFIWGDTWRCNECLARFADAGRTRGVPLLSSPEESTCDFCRRYSPTFLQPIVTRMGLLLFTAPDVDAVLVLLNLEVVSWHRRQGG